MVLLNALQSEVCLSSWAEQRPGHTVLLYFVCVFLLSFTVLLILTKLSKGNKPQFKVTIQHLPNYEPVDIKKKKHKIISSLQKRDAIS